ncbi:DUF2059 domain-containing protein [Brevundimonas vesicularis]|uniref:DUF2059 domain-containing protein n=1 Tax=Brevundimonas vesicularis TaxID=41276 RepID=UPI0038D40EDB
MPAPADTPNLQVVVMPDDPDGRRALARRMMLVKMADLEKQVRQDVELQVAQLTDAPPAEVAWMRKTATDLLVEHGQVMGEALEALFAEQFTLEELQALVALYEGPQGRSIARKEFAMGNDMVQIIARFQTGFLTDLLSSYCGQFDCGEGAGKAPSANKRGRS